MGFTKLFVTIFVVHLVISGDAKDISRNTLLEEASEPVSSNTDPEGQSEDTAASDVNLTWSTKPNTGLLGGQGIHTGNVGNYLSNLPGFQGVGHLLSQLAGVNHVSTGVTTSTSEDEVKN